MDAFRPTEWTWPQRLLVGLALAVTLGAVFALSTSAAAFGVYNPAWDGASGLTDLADETDADAQIAVNTTAYERARPNETVAVILSPNERYSATDRRRVYRFVDAGGTLVVAEDVGPVGNSLLAALGADTRFDGQPVRDERNYYRSPAFPTASNVSDAPETEGVKQLTLNHGTALRANPAAEDTDVLVRTSPYAYLDANRNEQLDDDETLAPRPVVVRERVGNGTVIVVSDPSVFINAMLERPGNRRFARNLLDAHDRVLLDYSRHGQQPPLSMALLALRGTPLLQGLVGLLGVGAVLAWSRRPEQVRQLLDRTRRQVAAIAGTDRTSERSTRSPIDVETGHLDPDALATYLRRQHPDWDERRVQRVITGVLARRREGGDDDRSG
jgi:hypothetical protein